MAPEQIRGASNVDGRADLYSVALIVFEALCGRLPFEATTQMAILAEKLEAKPKRLRDFAQVVVPEKLDALLAKGLARKPEERFASAMEMLRAVRLLGPATEPPRAIVPMPTGGHGLPSETVLTAVSQARTPTLGSKAGVAVAAVTGAIAVLVLLVLLRDVISPPPRPPPEIVGAATSPPTVTVPAVTDPPPSSAEVVVPVDMDDLVDAGARPKPHLTGVGTIRRPGTGTAGTGTIKKPQPSATHITTQPRY